MDKQQALQLASENNCMWVQPDQFIFPTTERLLDYTRDIEIATLERVKFETRAGIEAEIDRLTKEGAASGMTTKANVIAVDATALRQLLSALNGHSYEVRELQVTRNLPGFDNPIDTLIDQFNAWVSAQSEHSDSATAEGTSAQ